MTSPGPDWVEQARRFVVGSGLADALSGAAFDGATRPDDGAPGAGHAAECRWCPLCAGLAALRGRRPDLVEGLADVLSAAAAALRTHAAATADRDGSVPATDHVDPPAGQAAEPAPPPAPLPDPVQRIDVA